MPRRKLNPMPDQQTIDSTSTLLQTHGFRLQYAGVFGVQWNGPNGARVEWIHHSTDAQWMVTCNAQQFRTNTAADAIACLQHHKAI